MRPTTGEKVGVILETRSELEHAVIALDTAYETRGLTPAETTTYGELRSIARLSAQTKTDLEFVLSDEIAQTIPGILRERAQMKETLMWYAGQIGAALGNVPPFLPELSVRGNLLRKIKACHFASALENNLEQSHMIVDRNHQNSALNAEPKLYE